MGRRSIVAASLAVLLLGLGALLPPAGLRPGAAQANSRDLARRAFTYLQRSRSAAEPSFLSRAESLLESSLRLNGKSNFHAFLGMASLSNARHDFQGSVGWARKAIDVNPYNASPHGVLGDALFELGHYRAADAAYQRMIDIRPDLASYVRASYTYQSRGRSRAAIGALRLALEAAGPRGRDAAWIRHQLGDVYFGLGRLGKAARQNRIGTRVAPGYVPPRVGLAEVEIARGRLGHATLALERATKKLPSIEYLVTLGDLYAATDRKGAAQRQYDLALRKIRDHYAHGVGPDVDFILFHADHGVDLVNTLAQAQAMYRQRPTAGVADALAWTLHALGRNKDAWPFVRRALGSPIGDAAFNLHAGVIALSLGKVEVAKEQLAMARRLRLQLSPVQLDTLQASSKLLLRR